MKQSLNTRKLLSLTAHSGDSSVVLPVLGLVWWYRGFQPAGPMIAAMVAVLSAMAIAGVSKRLFRRSRPGSDWGGMYRRFDPHSFPSGHAARTLALAFAVLIGVGPVPGLILLAWSGAVGLSRIVLGVHWPSDIVAGWLLGLMAGLASGLFLA